MRRIGNISSQLEPDPPVEQTTVIGFGLRTYREEDGTVGINHDRCHVTVQEPSGEQFHGDMDRGQVLDCNGWRVVWEAGEPHPRVER